MKEQEVYDGALRYNNRDYFPKQTEMIVRKVIRKDLKKLRKAFNQSRPDYIPTTSDEDFDARVRNKVMFGSDSDKDIDEFVLTSDTPYNEEEYGEENDEI